MTSRNEVSKVAIICFKFDDMAHNTALFFLGVMDVEINLKAMCTWTVCCIDGQKKGDIVRHERGEDYILQGARSGSSGQCSGSW